MEWDGCTNCDQCDVRDLKLHGKCGCHLCRDWAIVYVWTTDGRSIMLIQDRRSN